MALVSSSAQASQLQPEQSLQNAINAFKSILTKDQQAQLDSIKSVPHADAVLVFTAELDRKRQRDSKWGRSIASRLSKVLRCVRDFSAIIDTFVSSHPEIAALVWGSIKLTMHTVINFTSYYEAVAEFFMKIGQRSPLFNEYQALFSGSKGLQKRLCDYHAAIIRCCSHIVVALQRSGFNLFMNSLRQSFDQEFEEDAKDIEMHSNQVEAEIRLATAQAIMRNQELAKLEAQKSTRSEKFLARFHEETRNKLDSIKEMQLHRHEQELRSRRQALLDSLSTHDHHEPFNRERKKRYNRTAIWLFETKEFKSWMDTTKPTLLWCSGKMGSGKTILATSIIDHVYTLKSHGVDRAAYFFARFDHPESLRAETILRSIARQLIDQDDLSGHMMTLLEELKTNFSSQLDDIVSLIKETLDPQSKLFLIFDGLDACTVLQQKRLFTALKPLLNSHHTVKVFASSRLAHFSAMSGFQLIQAVSMNCQQAQSDLEDIVTEAVQTALDEEALAVRDSSLIGDIERALTINANGMLLWVTLQLREICAQCCDGDIRAAISSEQLPKDLKGAFNRLLSRIASGPNEMVARRLLPWILAAKRPLTLGELEECGLIDIFQKQSMEDRRVNGIHRIDAWFEGLVEVDEEQRTVHFIHGSVQRFLFSAPPDPDFSSFHFQPKEADHYLGEICITFLHFNDLDRKVAERPKPVPRPVAPDDLLQQIRSLGMAAQYWKQLVPNPQLERGSKHKELSAPEGDLGNVSFWNSDDASLIRSIECMHPFIKYASIHWISHTSSFRKQKSQTWKLWEIMITQGHHLAWSPVTDRVHKSLNINMVSWAMRGHHLGLLHLITILDDRQYDVILLEWAVVNRNEELLKPLLNAREWGWELNRVFVLSAKNLYLEGARLLLEHGANVDAGGTRLAPKDVLQSFAHDPHTDHTAIHYAVIHDNLPLLELLIKAGASLNVFEPGGNPLQLATTKQRHECMKFLLSSGADVNPHSSADSALAIAIATGDIEGMNILLRYGADTEIVNHQSRRRIPLQMAVDLGNHEAVRTLLGAKADPNPAIYDIAMSPLQSAFRQHDFTLMGMLLQAGADPNQPMRDNLTALHIAIATGDVNLIALLLEAGANPNEPAATEGGNTPLQTAALRGNSVVVQMLLSTGANPDSSLSGGLTPLQIASIEGHAEVVQLLLDAGAKVDACAQGYEETPLLEAAKRGHVQVQELLIQRGANVKAVLPRNGLTPLHYAVRHENEYAVKMLLKAGADPSQLSTERTPKTAYDYTTHGSSCWTLLHTYQRVLDDERV